MNGKNWLKTIVCGLLLALLLPLSAATYYLQSTGSAPWPCDPYGGEMPVSVVDEAQHIYLVEDEGGVGMRGMSTMSFDFPLPGEGGTNSGYIEYTNTYTVDTNGLWLSVEGIGQFQLHNATNAVYAILSKTNLSEPVWKIEGDLWPTNTEAMPFTLSSTADSLFVWAKDWTEVDADADGLPDWWEWEHFQTLAYSGTDTDANGNTYLYDYQNDLDPNVIQFTLKAASRYVAGSYPNLQVNVTAGTPFYYVVSVDDTNFMAATDWLPYTSSSLTVPLGIVEGWHGVWVGLKGRSPDSLAVWQWKRLKRDTQPPQITVTNALTVDVPLLQLRGYSDEALSRITYDLTNALGVVTNQDVGVDSRFDGATNGFHAYDVELTNGVNVITVHAVDMAGNETITNFTFVLDYSNKTNPPVVQITWPQDGMEVTGDRFTLDGFVNDSAATVLAQTTSTNGTTNTVQGLMERTGRFWVENLPLNPGTNFITLTITDAAGNVATTNLFVVQSSLVLTMNPVTPDSDLWKPKLNLTGTILETDYAIWVNGVKGHNNGDGTWYANGVPTTTGGVASFTLTAYKPDEQQPDGSYGN